MCGYCPIVLLFAFLPPPAHFCEFVSTLSTANTINMLLFLFLIFPSPPPPPHSSSSLFVLSIRQHRCSITVSSENIHSSCLPQCDCMLALQIFAQNAQNSFKYFHGEDNMMVGMWNSLAIHIHTHFPPIECINLGGRHKLWKSCTSRSSRPTSVPIS